MPSWKLIGAWLLALGITTALTWQAVSMADSQVSAGPAEIVAVPEPDPPAGVPPLSTTSTSPTASTSTSTPGATSTSDTTVPVSEEDWQVHTVTTVGGTVIVRYRTGAVELQAATPLPGFEMEIDDTGPARVRVEFESYQADIRVDVEPEGDSIAVEIED